MACCLANLRAEAQRIAMLHVPQELAGEGRIPRKTPDSQAPKFKACTSRLLASVQGVSMLVACCLLDFGAEAQRIAMLRAPQEGAGEGSVPRKAPEHLRRASWTGIARPSISITGMHPALFEQVRWVYGLARFRPSAGQEAAAPCDTCTARAASASVEHVSFTS